MMGGMGIFEFPAMIEPDGSMGNLIVAVSGVILTMILAFAGTMIFYKEPEKEKALAVSDGNGKTEAAGDGKEPSNEEKEEGIIRKTEIASPIKGKVLKLCDIQDEAFASGVLGKGVAILPEAGEVYAPANGVVSALFPTLHAIGLTTEEGAEVLIHIGLDTVQLNGEGFEALVAAGDQVKKGQLLIRFDMDFISGKGYCLETPVLITNSDQFLDVVETSSTVVASGENLLNLLK